MDGSVCIFTALRPGPSYSRWRRHDMHASPLSNAADCLAKWRGRREGRNRCVVSPASVVDVQRVSFVKRVTGVQGQTCRSILRCQSRRGVHDVSQSRKASVVHSPPDPTSPCSQPPSPPSLKFDPPSPAVAGLRAH